MKSFLLLVSCFFVINIYAQSCSDGGTTRWEWTQDHKTTCKTVETADATVTVYVTPKNVDNDTDGNSKKTINTAAAATDKAVKNNESTIMDAYYHYNKADDLDVSVYGGFGAFK